MKELVVSLLKNALDEIGLKLEIQQIENFIERSPSSDLGDWAFPCFFAASKLKQNPHETALTIREKLGSLPGTENFEDIQVKGGYVNFFVNRKQLALSLVKEILKKKDNFGKTDLGHRKKIIVEFSSPNIAKPFGIGHLRSTIIGNSLAKICEFNNFKAIKINYLGDWGTQFGRLITSYKKFGDARKLNSKEPIKYLLQLYVKANKKQYDKKAQEEFRKLEEGDRENLKLWKKFKKLSLKDFEKIYRKLGIEFDIVSGESFYNSSLIKIVDMLGEKKLLKKSQGALIVNLKKYNFGVCLIKKADGSTIYAVRDIAAAIDRHKKFKFEKMIYEVGQEQNLHFKQFFKVLDLMGYEWAKNCFHVSHGLYLGDDGKKFSTRKGKTIFMEDIFEKTIKLAEKEIKKRFPGISRKTLDKRASKVAVAAILYGDLKNKRTSDTVFNIKKFISFEGNTGPYLLYSYARASSILRKAKGKLQKNFQIPEELEEKEIELIKKFSQFSEIVLKSYSELNPAIIANYSYQLAKIFNEFYHACPVIDSRKKEFRISLVKSFKQVMKNSLALLGIDVLEKM